MTACSQAEHAVLSELAFGLDFVADGVGNAAGALFYLGENVGGNLLHACDFRAFHRCLGRIEGLRNLV